MLRPQDYSFIALGGGNEIGGSCYALRLKDKTIMLDAGIKYSQTLAARVPDVTPLYSLWELDGLWELDAVIISHAHLDHSGALPVFMRDLHGVNIYSSEATPDILCALCRDNFTIRKRDIAALSDTFIPLKFAEPVNAGGFTLTLYPAGHMPGAAMTLIDDGEFRVLYTGDFCMTDQLTVNGADIPDMKINTLICESTHGYSAYSGQLSLRDTADKINALLAQADTFTCTVKNPGRAAEISAAVCECMSKNMIPEIDIWIDECCEQTCRPCSYNNHLSARG